MYARILTLAAVVGTLAAAPAAAQTDTTTTPAAPPSGEATPRTDAPAIRVPRQRRDLNTITWEEIRNGQYANAYEVVHHLRPSWLRTPRGPNSINMQIDVAVFIDGIRLGSRAALESIPITSVRSMRFFTAIDARQRFGGDTSVGAIEIYRH
jgi:hypothetical protein